MRFLVPATGLLCLALIGCLKGEPAPDTDTAATDVVDSDAPNGDVGLTDATPDSGGAVDFCAIGRNELSLGADPTPPEYIPDYGEPCECMGHAFYFNPDQVCTDGYAQCAIGLEWVVYVSSCEYDAYDDTGTEQ